ncbi:MAG: PD-(D/E)XK nuclease family protein [Clostridiales bacterium]|nr:PD-(D/E)XK nuclease family protein [Clostridiales bacterium]
MIETISNDEIINDAISKLKALESELRRIKTVKSQAINIFEAVGMTTQEIKHSAFLAWLLNPKMPHELKSRFLKAFLQNLLFYERDNVDVEGYLSNKQILSSTGVFSIKDLQELLDDNKLSVLTERTLTLDGDDGRIDIFIESEKAKTLIAIENKVFTSTHDDQLKRYVTEFDSHINWKKIFIYLTPTGDLPYDIDRQYAKEWCILSYETVLDTVRGVLADVHNTKLKNLMGDYIEMVDTNILKNNKELKNLCDEIRKNHKEAIELLLFYTDIVERVNRHCAQWLKDNIQGISNVNILPTRTDFCTENIKKFFASKGEDWKLDDARHKFTYRISCKDGPLIGSAFMEKNPDKNSNWDSAQIYINEHYGQSKRMGNIYCTVFKASKLLDEGFRENGFEEIKDSLEEGLRKFKQQIDDFEKKLLNL